MPLNILFEAIITVIELLRLSLIAAIPAFAVSLAAEKLQKKLATRFSLNWIQSTLISTYLIVTLLIMVLYIVPAYIGWMESPLTHQQPLPELQATMPDLLGLYFASLLHILVVGIVYTILLLPFIFVAVFALEKAREKWQLPELANKFIAAFAACLLFWVVLLFIFPFAAGGLLYLLFWS